MFVLCRVVAGVPSKPLVGASLRTCRIEGDLDDSAMPEVDETTQAYVVTHTQKIAFYDWADRLKGASSWKSSATASYPTLSLLSPWGALLLEKIKGIQKVSKKAKGSMSCKFTVVLDMQESVLLDTQNKLKFEEVELGGKHRGAVTIIEDYGVFVVCIENSERLAWCTRVNAATRTSKTWRTCMIQEI
jgi:hypothetical protein